MEITTDFFSRPLRLQPHYTPRPWGGTRLRSVLGKDVPADSPPVGESWELSDHPDGRSTIHAPGTDAHGVSFGDILRQYPRPMIGRGTAPEKYPLLVKYIDAEGNLSVQVHPDDAWCEQHRHPDRGKSECWYVMDTAPDARVVYGFQSGTSAAEMAAALGTPQYRALLRFPGITTGDFLAIPPGRVHAMLAGTLVCEIQQSSNTTFRTDDWDRKPARELHLPQAREVSLVRPEDYPPIKSLGHTPAAGSAQRLLLLQNEFFRVDLLEADAQQALGPDLLTAPTGTILNVVGGYGRLEGEGWHESLVCGQTLYLPAALREPLTLRAGGAALRVLRTESREL